MRSRILKQTLVQHLSVLYDNREAVSIAQILLEELLGKEMYRSDAEIPQELLRRVSDAEKRLLTAEPLQYVLGYSWFGDLTLEVGPGVLIPRPETEELVAWVVSDQQLKGCQITDIGTGSGAIAISLAKMLPHCRVQAFDVSEIACQTAAANIQKYKVQVVLKQADLFAAEALDLLGNSAVWVCNPPYIPEHEALDMHLNVRQFEPDLALFVPDTDPLKYYRRLFELAACRSENGLVLYAEIHPKYTGELHQMAVGVGFRDVTQRTDAQGNLRMMRFSW